MVRSLLFASLLAILAPPLAAADPDNTVQSAAVVLQDVMHTPGKAIPLTLLQDAQAVIIVPRTIKLGFIVGAQRGHGVVLTRQADGTFSAPQFVTVTGGSIGWQAGAQASDFILLFRTPESVERFLDGKFTIGADASAAAGPVGRRVNASTDIELHSEILSYARSKGLFAGVSLDGSVLQLDAASTGEYYRGSDQAPQSAAQLVDLLNRYSGVQVAAQPVPGEQVPANVLPAEGLPPRPPADRQQLSSRESARRALAAAAPKMYGPLPEDWRTYLALPAEIFDTRQPHQPQALAESLKRFDMVARDARYQALAGLREFQQTHRHLKAYTEELSRAADEQPRLALPPPPEQPSARRGVKRASAIVPAR